MSDFQKQYAIGQFGKKVISKLAKKGITFVDAQQIPGNDGNFATGETGYGFNNNGTYIMRTYLQVLKLAE